MPSMPHMAGYRFRAGDEAIGPGLRARPAYADIAGYFRELKPEAIENAHTSRDEWSEKAGLSFTVDGELRGFGVDLVPRIITNHEWKQLAKGLTQRARAVESFLQDAYGRRRIVADGVLTEAQVVDAMGYRAEAAGLPTGTVRAPIQGFDLVRNEFGGWRVLEDNVRSPSGAAYAVAVRHLLNDVVADAPRPVGLLDPESVFGLLRETLTAHSDKEAPVVALLTEGPSSSAWYEHQALAAGAGFLLVTAGDLTVDNGLVLARSDGERSSTVVDTVYLRLDRELIDVATEADPDLGVRIMGVAADGNVFLANAPGNGLADDKAMYVAVPDLIEYYLDEKPLLEGVPTYRLSDESERLSVLERVGELVTKPVDGEGGHGVLIGPSANAATVAERRAAIAADPDRWVAQEVVTLSLHPTLTEHGLEPRHVDLRAFVYLTGTGPFESRLADFALTRVAPEGSMVVNSSQGGGAKDTWIIGTAGER
jgi:carboxylate-amine ligase